MFHVQNRFNVELVLIYCRLRCSWRDTGEAISSSWASQIAHGVASFCGRTYIRNLITNNGYGIVVDVSLLNNFIMLAKVRGSFEEPVKITTHTRPVEWQENVRQVRIQFIDT